MRIASRATVYSGFLSVMLVASGHSSRALRVSHPLWSYSFVNREFQTASSPVVSGSGVVAFEVARGIAGVDARSGRRLWSSSRATDGMAIYGSRLFANRQSMQRSASGSFENTLVAMNLRNGEILWSRPEKGGPKVADDNRLYVSNSVHGATSFTHDGRILWVSPRARGDSDIRVNGRYVVVVGSGGEPSRGVLYAIARTTGRYVGSNYQWIGRLLELKPSEVIAEDTFPGEVSWLCLGARLVSVRMSARDDASGAEPLLDFSTSYYPVDAAVPATKDEPCLGKGPASITLDRTTVVVASDALTTFYDRGGTRRRGVVLRGARFIGGPVDGSFLVESDWGLEGVRLASAGRVTRTRLLSRQNPQSFSIAGGSGRLYASDGTNVYLFDSARLDRRPLGIYDFPCRTNLMRATRVGSVDVLACADSLVENGPRGRVAGFQVPELPPA